MAEEDCRDSPAQSDASSSLLQEQAAEEGRIRGQQDTFLEDLWTARGTGTSGSQGRARLPPCYSGSPQVCGCSTPCARAPPQGLQRIMLILDCRVVPAYSWNEPTALKSYESNLASCHIYITQCA